MGATSAMAPPLLRNLITTISTITDRSLHTLSTHSNLLKFIRRIITSFLLYFLSSFISNPNPSPNNNTHLSKNPKDETFSNNNNDSGLARALSQLLTIVNDVPVSSRKYEFVRSLAERIVDDNNRKGLESLREVNRRALTTSFERTLRRLENFAVAEERGDLGFGLLQADFYYLGRALKALRYVGDVALARVVNFKPVAAEEAVPVAPGGGLGEKLAAEVLWLAQKLAACGYVEEAVDKWASASGLAWLSLRVEPRLQGSIVKVSAFLFKQAAVIGRDGEAMDEELKMKQKVMKMKMLVSWLPLLCRASNGVDAPVLIGSERGELGRILEEMIDGLDCLEDQEKVLSLWLQHFTYCPSSDWPNLRECYSRWCNESRKQMLL